MANKYDLELALDSYRAQNGKESEVGLMDSGEGVQYGSQRFSSREQAMWWLKQQKPNHDAIQKMIAEERKNYPNSGLGPLMDTYEKYYKQVQAVQSQTEKKLGEEKVVPKVEEPVKTIPGETRRVDGLPEPTRYPPTPQSIPGPTRRTDGLPESPRYPIAPAPVLPVQPQKIVEPPLEKELASPTMEGLKKAMTEFKKTYTAVNEKTNKILPDHEKDVETRNINIQQSAKVAIDILRGINATKLSESERKIYEQSVLEVAKYFSNELKGINSKQYADYNLAFDLAASIILPVLKESKITLPTPPTEDDFEKRLKGINPSLHARYVEALKKGWKKGQFLSNPKIRAEWIDVQSKINGEYEDAMQKKLGEIKETDPNLKTPEQYAALKLMKTIMGSSGLIDFKKRNIDNWIQTGGAIGSAIGGGIVGIATVGTLGWTGVGALAGASLIGASIATAGGAITRGTYSERGLMTEGVINLATFGVAGKVGQIAKAKYIDKGRAIAGYSIDGTTGLALGVTGEYTRALSDGASLGDLPHWKMIATQLPWALLPMSMGGLAHLKSRAQKLQDGVNIAKSQKNVGETHAADQTLEKLAPETKALATEVQTAVENAHPAPASNNISAVGGKPLEPLPPITETHAPAATAKAKTSASSVSPDAFHAAEASPSHPTSGAHHPNAKNASNYKFEGWKTIDKILLGDGRKFREIFPMADNNMWQGMGKLTKGEIKIGEAIHNSAAWVQNQTFSQIYREMAMPWRGDKVSLIKSAGDNIRTLLISGESGKWMSKDRLGKLGIIVSAVTLDYVTSDQFQKNANGLGESIAGGVDFVFGKYILNPEQAMKLYQEIILLNWVSIVAMNAGAIVGAGTGIAGATLGKVAGRVTEVPAQ